MSVVVFPGRGTFVRRIIGSRAYDGGAGNGAVGAATIFTVTGEVYVVILVSFCTENLVGLTATISLGITGSTALFVAATTAEDIDNGEFWVDTVPDANGVDVPTALLDVAITDDILTQIATAAVTDGTIRFTLYWLPLSSDGNVTLASGVT